MLFKVYKKKKNIPHPSLSIRRVKYCQSPLPDKDKTAGSYAVKLMCIVPSEKSPTPAETATLCRDFFSNVA